MKEIIPEVVADDPFKNCAFNRKNYSEILRYLIMNNADGFVLSINNGWGTGKTTFIRMFMRDLELNQFDKIYINAWENDYETDPFLSILSEIKTAAKSIKAQQEITSVVEKGSKVVAKAGVSLIKHLVTKYAGNEFAEILLKQTEELALEEINSISDAKNIIKTFKTELRNYLSSRENSDKPLVIIVDELDRCKPDYGIKLLETIKHFFDIPNIVFILSVDQNQLYSAVKGFYGTDEVDSKEYLRKFIDLEVSLPNPEITEYIKLKLKQYTFAGYISRQYQIKPEEMRERLFNAFVLYFTGKDIPVRKINKILSHLNQTTRGFWNSAYAMPEVIVFLIYLKFCKNDIYENLKLKKIEVQEILEIILNDYSKADLRRDIRENIISAIISFIPYWYNIDFETFNKDYRTLITDPDFPIHQNTIDKELDMFERYATNTNFFNIIDFFNPEYAMSKQLFLK